MKDSHRDGRTDAFWERAELTRVIERVRRRWRIKIALRGLAVTAAAAVVGLTAMAVALERADIAPAVAVGFRIALAAALVAIAIWFLLIPLFRRVSTDRVALYLEEHEPSLDAALVSALDEGGATSPALARRTIETAVERCAAVGDGIAIERPSVRRYGAVLAGVVFAAAMLGIFAPVNLRHATGLLASPPRGGPAAVPMRVDVMPGDTTVARGADQVITARLRGFQAERAELVLVSAVDSTARRLPQRLPQRLPMTAGEEPGSFGLLLFDLESDVDYFVEADGVRSAMYHITVAELPYAERIDLEYRYPAYSGLPPRTVRDGGDIAALEGTTVRVRVHPTFEVPGGRIVLESGRSIPLEPVNGTGGVLVGSLRVQRRGFYHIELAGTNGRMVVASQNYIIDVLDDAPPAVSFSEPGRDVTATAIEEFYIEVEAADDYGVARLELVYSVNGRARQTIELFGAGNALREVSVGHTFYLEEFGLQAGDFIAYYARATDTDVVAGPKHTASDIYFIEIRPFARSFRQADAARGQGAAGGAAAGADRALSERQRQIISATFNLSRDSADYAPDAFRENIATVRMAQQRLRAEASTLARRMVTRGVTADSAYGTIAELLPRAADAMGIAIERLRDGGPTDAIPAEQRALLYLQRAEAVFREVVVSAGRPGSSTGTPGTSRLSELFELNSDQLESPYQTLQRGAPDTLSRQLNETLSRLEELARRQQRQRERLRNRSAARASGRPAGAAGGGAAQRRLAERVEEQARRLERLSRQNARPELERAARQLRQAADAMRRAAASGASGTAAADEASERLERARRLLERARGAATERGARAAMERLRRIENEQEALFEELRELGGIRPGERRREATDSLRERIDAQADRVADLQRELYRLGAAARGEQDNAARRLREAAESIRRNQLELKVRYMRRLARAAGRRPEVIDRLEGDIAGDLDELRRRMERAADAFEPITGDSIARTLERAGDLARGVNSLSERLGQAGSAEGAAPQRRQFRAEAARRLEDARSLRERLERNGRDIAGIDDVIEGLDRLSEPGIYADSAELARLRTALAESATLFEFRLRRELALDEGARLFLSGSGDVPAGFRELVEEYYRALAEGRTERGQP